MSRPNSSLGARKLNGPPLARPATSLDTHTEDGGSVLGKRKGTPPFSLFSPDRSHSYSVGPLVESHPASWWGHGSQPAPSSDLETAGVGNCSQSATYPSTQASQNTESQILTPMRSVQQSRVPIATPMKPPRAPATSPCRTHKKSANPLFLSKYSSVTNFDHRPGAEWDQERREKNMEEMFAAFMTQMNQQGQQSSGLKETIEVYKSRSE